MTDDLVKRLQMWAHECEEQHGPGMWSQDMRLAANRIEELEMALEEIANGARDADKSYVSLFHELQFEARAALGEKKHD